MWTGMADFYLIGYKSGNQRLAFERLASEELSGCIWLSYRRAERGFNHINTLIVPLKKSLEEWGSVFWQPSDFFIADHNCWAVPGKAHWVIAYLDSNPLQLFQLRDFSSIKPRSRLPAERVGEPNPPRTDFKGSTPVSFSAREAPKNWSTEGDGCSQALPVLIGYRLQTYLWSLPLSASYHWDQDKSPQKVWWPAEQEMLKHFSL